MKQKSLGRVASDFIGEVLYFRDAPDHMRPACADLRTHLMKLLEVFAGHPTARGLAPEELDAARFALAAFADEIILKSDWTSRDFWRQELLQTILHNTNRGGDEFYERLQALPSGATHAREVMFLCLVMGFEGRMMGDEAGRQELIRGLYEMLRAARHAVDPPSPQHLTAAAYNLAIEVESGSRRRLWPILATWALGTVICFGGLLLALWLLAGSIDLPNAI